MKSEIKKRSETLKADILEFNTKVTNERLKRERWSKEDYNTQKAWKKDFKAKKINKNKLKR